MRSWLRWPVGRVALAAGHGLLARIAGAQPGRRAVGYRALPGHAGDAAPEVHLGEIRRRLRDRPAVYVGEHLQDYVPYVATELATVVATVGEVAGGLEFVDSDADGFDETVTVTFPCDDAIDPASLVLYANGQFGKPAARIHPFVDATIADGEAVITLDVWQ